MDPFSCRFCGKKFENNQNKSQHFRKESKCNRKLKTFDFSLLEEVSHKNIEYFPQPNSDIIPALQKSAKNSLNIRDSLKIEEKHLNLVESSAIQQSGGMETSIKKIMK